MYVIAPTSWVRKGNKDTASKQSVWSLTRAAYEMIAAELGIEESYATKPLSDLNARHYVRTNELYVAAKPYLDEELESYPWEWLNEKRVAYAGEFADERYVHEPDAHIVFCNAVFIVERQTAESKIGPKTVEEKIAGHARYAELVLKRDQDERPAYEEAEVLFACDELRIAQEAESSGRRHGVPVVAGNVHRLADYLHNSATRLR